MRPGIIVFILMIACSSPRTAVVVPMEFNDIISRAIGDYTNRSLHDAGKIFSVSAEYVADDIVGVSIVDFSSGSVYITKTDTIGSNSEYFPSRYKEINGKLFYWYDPGSLVSRDLLEKLVEYDHIDSAYYFDPNKVLLSSNESVKAIHYYFCAGDISKYVRREAKVALGYGKVPRINCH